MDEARQSTQLLQRVERARRVVSHCSQAAIRAYDEEALLSEACRHLIDVGGYRMAWFAEAIQGREHLVTLAHAQAEASGVRGDPLPWSSDVDPWAPTRRALVEQRPRVVRGIAGNAELATRHPDAATLGYGALCAFPIQFGPHGAGVLTIYASEPDAFAPEEVALLRELAGDMAVGVSVLRARKANDRLEEQVEVAERRFRSIVEHAPVGVLQVGADGRLLIANQALAQLLGYSSPDDLRVPETDYLARHLAPEDLERVRQAIMQGAPYPSTELALRRRDGSTVWAQVDAKPANGGTLGGIEAFVRDLTAERSAENARQSEDHQRLEVVRLQELDRMRLEFMGRASHELNTPLTPILIQVQALQTTQLDDRQSRGLILIERNVQRLANLVRDLLSASTLQARQVILEPKPFDLAAKVAEVAESFHDQADRAGVTLDMETTAPVMAFAEASRVGQVLFNLVSNALKFTPRGGAITIQCKPQGDRVLCAVTDTGLGFSPSDHAKLFAPFGRVHEHLPGDPGGTGLGLFISQSIVEQSGGTLVAESLGRGKGSTFSFTLPAAPASAKPSGAPGRGIVLATGFHDGASPKVSRPEPSMAAAALPSPKPEAEPQPVQSAGRTRNK